MGKLMFIGSCDGGEEANVRWEKFSSTYPKVSISILNSVIPQY